jgi:hypothetical protein
MRDGQEHVMDDFLPGDTQQADLGHRVLYVLAVSLVLAAIGMIAVAFTS